MNYITINRPCVATFVLLQKRNKTLAVENRMLHQHQAALYLCCTSLSLHAKSHYSQTTPLMPSSRYCVLFILVVTVNGCHLGNPHILKIATPRGVYPENKADETAKECCMKLDHTLILRLNPNGFSMVNSTNIGSQHYIYSYIYICLLKQYQDILLLLIDLISQCDEL